MCERHRDPWCAVPTLGGDVFVYTALYGMEFTFRSQAFDGLDLATMCFGGQCDARQTQLSVDSHGAGAAIANIAAVFTPREVQVFT